MNEEELLSILCNDRTWAFDIEQTYIGFEKDNTGILSAVGGFCYHILSEFEWKATIIEPLDHNQTPDHETSRLIGLLNVEITLSGRPPPWAQKMLETNKMVNAGSLTDDAFQPKSFIVRIEDGNFFTPESVCTFKKTGRSSEKTPDWTKRLVFDKSPYPLESDWKDSWKELWMTPADENYWDCKEFVAYSPKVEEFKTAQRASLRQSTNDN